MTALRPGMPELWAVEPWPEAIETAAILGEVANQIRKYVALPDAGVTAAALWTLQTWIHETVAIHSPILAAVSVEPESGKSRFWAIFIFWSGERLSSSNRPDRPYIAQPTPTIQH